VPLGNDYPDQACSLARSLEIIGERWTFLIVRDAFMGVSRFNDFAAHLNVSRGVLARRLATLVDSGVLQRSDGERGPGEYELTEKGVELWPAIRCLLAWGDENYSSLGPRRLMHHEQCGTLLDVEGWCSCCERVPSANEVLISPGPGLEAMGPDADLVTKALARTHRVLDPLDTASDARE
jgi:DNA-binding HxlR family transcriptional regulator